MSNLTEWLPLVNGAVRGQSWAAVSVLLLLLLGMGWIGGSRLSCASAAPTGTLITQPDALIYLPSGASATHRRPIVFAFSPTRDANSLIRFWQPYADKHRLIIYASREYVNHMPDLDQRLPLIHEHMAQALKKLPANPRQVIFTGMSGGGSFSQVVNIAYPGMASAMIINTGRIWDRWYHHANNRQSAFRDRFAQSGQANAAVLLMSPTDFRYQEMGRDEALLKALGWQVRRTEFKGGHTIAPPALYEQSLQWIFSQPGWKGAETP